MKMKSFAAVFAIFCSAIYSNYRLYELKTENTILTAQNDSLTKVYWRGEIEEYFEDARIFSISKDTIETKIALDSCQSINNRYFRGVEHYLFLNRIKILRSELTRLGHQNPKKYQ